MVLDRPANPTEVVGAHQPDCRIYKGWRCSCKHPGPDAPAGEWPEPRSTKSEEAS